VIFVEWWHVERLCLFLLIVAIASYLRCRVCGSPRGRSRSLRAVDFRGLFMARFSFRRCKVCGTSSRLGSNEQRQ